MLKLQTPFKPLILNQLKIKTRIELSKNKKRIQKIETVRYSVLFDHTFSDQNYLKVCKFCRYESSLSFLNYFLLIFQTYTFQ